MVRKGLAKVAALVVITRQEQMTHGEMDFQTIFSSGIQPLLVGFLVWMIGMALGGPTGYAINPARDLGPRIAHAILPIAGKGDSGWKYAWIYVLGPILGGVAAALLYISLWPQPAAG